MIEHERTFEFGSVFADAIENYLQLKKAVGEKPNVPGTVLRLFDRYCMERSVDIPMITSELVNAWLAASPENKKRTRGIKISVLKGFAAYYASIGNPVTWIPHAGYAATEPRYVPYIFSENEIINIIQAADSLRQNYGKTRFHIIFPVILRVLYGSGLRISEALRLRIQDVDLENGSLCIFDGKFEKSRRIPISDSLRLVLERYYETNFDYINSFDDEFFFPNPNGEQYSQRTFYDKFREILWKAGISHRGKGYGPRVHDLRHTFAVRSLHQSIASGTDPYVALTSLMVYLGHSKIRSTEYYLRLTSDIYPEILEKIQTLSDLMIPEGGQTDES